MSDVNVSLPEPMRDWVEEQVRNGQYADANQYVLELIREDHDRHEALITALIEAENSGISTRTIDEIIAAAKSDVTYALSDDEMADIEAALEEADRGDFASEAEVEALFTRYKA